MDFVLLRIVFIVYREFLDSGYDNIADIGKRFCLTIMEDSVCLSFLKMCNEAKEDTLLCRVRSTIDIRSPYTVEWKIAVSNKVCYLVSARECPSR